MNDAYADGDEPNSFARLCDTQHERLTQFREDYPDLDVVLSAALNVGHLIVGSISLIRGLTVTETHRWMMWQTLLGYQQQSLLLIVSGNTDAGLALIRLAMELGRDVAVIQDHDERLELWLKRRDPARRGEYRRLFRFDDGTAAGAMARKAYDLCSEFGVHGHVSDAMHFEVVGGFAPPGRDEFAMLRISDAGVLSALQIWLTAFAWPHILCLETFGEKHGQELAEPSRLFMQMVDAIGPILTAIAVRLKELAASK
ncbi:MAG TPA: hypothetical protein VK752_28070 [Bryobacteraceae bacterium]|nr:hypothetical protein [Bryobacteraceae bacterium]